MQTKLPNPTLAAAVLAQCQRSPDAIAIDDAGIALSYAELEARSRQMAHGLLQAGIEPGQPVAIGLPRSWQLVCGMLAILRLGGTVVPLDQQSPPERLQHILGDSGSVAIIDDGAQAVTPGDGPPSLSLASLLATAGEAPLPAANAAPCCFLFYTSGTTGQPKGVRVRDAGILRLAEPGYIDLALAQRFACLSNPAFDALSFEVWVPLLRGGCCVIFSDALVQQPDRFAQALLTQRIDTLFMTVALFNTLADRQPDCFAGLRQLLIGGEQLNAPLLRRWYQHNAGSRCQIHNVYGPTETTTFALCYPIPPDFSGEVIPIGQPLAATGIALVVEGERAAAAGEVAELYLSGDGVAEGYQQLPEETARRFVRLPWLDGGQQRFYRTGDLVRRNAEGQIEYVGRQDRQVKVRGFRIEPGELERQILRHPAIRQAYVCTRRNARDDSNELLAYVVLQADLAFEAFDRHLAEHLPAYMRPHWIYLVDALPLNANGKVDQARLLQRQDLHWRHGDAGQQAHTPWQTEVLQLIGRVLGVPDLRLHDRWLGNGGDSLKALRLRFEVRQRWGCELAQASILQQDFGQLATTLASARDAQAQQRGQPDCQLYPPLPAASALQVAAATSEQQRLWLLQQQQPADCSYNVDLAFRLQGELSLGALHQALNALVCRHPALRTAFIAHEDGLQQQVCPPYDPCTFAADAAHAAPCLDEASWRMRAQLLAATPFDLAQPRLFTAHWLPLAPRHGILLLHLHHIVVDGWSLNLLLRDLSALYAAAQQGQPLLPPTATISPLDANRWQAEWFASPAYQPLRTQLQTLYQTAIASEPALPFAQAERGGRAHCLRESVDVVRRTALDRLGADLGLTRFQLLLCVFSWSLYGVTGRSQQRIASPVANRPLADFAESVGMFANTVLLPQQLAPDANLLSLLQTQAAQIQRVLDLQDVALAHALADSPAAQAEGAGFDSLFVLENTDFSQLALPGSRCRVEWLAPVQAKCPLTLSVVDTESGLECLWEYATGRFDAAQIQQMAQLWRQGLDALLAGHRLTLAELVTPYRQALPAPGRGAMQPLAFTQIADWFAAQVQATPDATALISPRQTVSYIALATMANRLAARLQARFLQEDAPATLRVALYLDASVEHVVALLALARLNLTIVPLDPAYPAPLLQQVLAQSQPLCLLSQPSQRAALDSLLADALPAPLPCWQLVCSPTADLANADLSDGDELIHLDAEADTDLLLLTVPPPAQRPLYTLFTSGSTGRPKGVQVPDATLCNLLQWQQTAGELQARARTLQFSMLAFDVSFQEILTTLCSGGSLQLIAPGLRQDMPALLACLQQSGIERLFMPCVALQMLAEHAVSLGVYPERLCEVIVAGEQLLISPAIRQWFGGLKNARLFNHYGPTETHVVSSLCLQGDPARWPERPSIGRAIANAELRLVDAAGLPLPAGCPGELWLGGSMVAPCYLDAAHNTSRFVTLPDGQCFYRSGDLACFDSEGQLHYLGREDQQIKLSGHRLELGQVEAALLSHPAIRQAVVVVDEGALVACLQCRDATPPDVQALRTHLATRLPLPVRIARFCLLPALPLTASGKLDRRQVAQLAQQLPALSETIADEHDRSSLEDRLCEAFVAATGKAISVSQRFFDAGAGSLDLMRFHLRCTAGLGLSLTIPTLFEHVSIRQLARHLSQSQPERSTALPVPHQPDAAIAIIGMAVKLPGAPDLAAFWQLVESGGRGMRDVPATQSAEGWVNVVSQLDAPLGFDPEYFGISRQEARLMDPQQRQLLMACVQALAHAGIADSRRQRIGIVASCGENTYYQRQLREAGDSLPDSFQMALHHDKDFLASKVAYHLDLTGPALTLQAACASSLVGVHLAAGLLRQGDSELMLVGGVLVDSLLSQGYRYRPQHIFSKDGHCRPFSDDASGTIGASGVGVVVLKPLAQAERDGDTIYAVLAGSAINNDGADKQGYTAPSVAGQREVIRLALQRSGQRAADIGYVEAHGTGTQLGDPIEVAALQQAYADDSPAHCALASVKSQIGHLGAAAGVVGLIRATLAVYHGQIPPNVDFHAPNPQIGPSLAPFYIPRAALPWPAGQPRLAAVSSFGIGGTNAHVLIRAGDPAPSTSEAPPPCLLLSASSEASLRQDAARIADYLATHPAALPRVLRHLQAGRPASDWRLAAVCPDVASAIAALRQPVVSRPSRQETPRPATGLDAPSLVQAWHEGAQFSWPAGPAPAPWDFPPPAFQLADYDLTPSTTTSAHDNAAAGSAAHQPGESIKVPQPTWPTRLPASQWLHQPVWARQKWQLLPPLAPRPATLLVLTDAPIAPLEWQDLTAAYQRTVVVSIASHFHQQSNDHYGLDPASASHWSSLLAALALGEQALDWLNLLPLTLAAEVSPGAMAQAQSACIDVPAALLQAKGPSGLRLFCLSVDAQPVDGPVRRPLAGLLAGLCTVVEQEHAVPCYWLDLPEPEPDPEYDSDEEQRSALTGWGLSIAHLMADPPPEVRKLALRPSFLWQQALVPLTLPVPQRALWPVEAGRHVVMGGAGGIGQSLAAWLLQQSPSCRLVLLARRAELPASLRDWADRIEMLAVDFADSASCEQALVRLLASKQPVNLVVHAVGTAAGGLIRQRDASAMREAQLAKWQAAWLMERLIGRYQPAFAVYCSSMASHFGGIGQLDYAAGNGLLDALAHYRTSPFDDTCRISINWDVWREVGMASTALRQDSRHQAHRAVGLSVAEGQQLFAQALQAGLPQIMISTTALDQASCFYATKATPAATAPAIAPAAASANLDGLRQRLHDSLCQWLGLDALDARTSLYDLGADSLTLLDLIDAIQQHSGISLTLAQFGHQVSLDEVMDLIDDATSAIAPAAAVNLQVWQTGDGHDLLCLIHPVGGDIQAYRPLVAALPSHLTVCLIADPALQTDSDLNWSLAERAQHYYAALQARFPAQGWRWQLAGWSFGGWVALALAALAENAGQPAQRLHLIDPPPPGSGSQFQHYSSTQLEAVFARELQLGANDSHAYAARLARCCQANLASMVGVELPRLAQTPVQLSLACQLTPGLPGPALPAAAQLGLWQTQLPRLDRWQMLECDHYAIVRPPHVVAIAAAVSEPLPVVNTPPHSPRL
ncbi:non-ribosomal peptide synthetase [Parachitinimonas caeni]|uniref:Amino acid adenylation domain-containing protein n=1 Tax=Parachitinimonas caeni TaxID=3031301 RepID=A0ABT7E154_9NEIS|nr:non-ribosomal peptide synthetase [Parachitinimonas caeni]MDK2126026.1 amino acid adenylation domain-containing protein [Parachitinimonas caeni]